MERQPGGLWTPNAVGLLRHRPRTGTAPNGEWAKEG
jgi:hypothetical protein